jgi:hypothetical protein
MNSPNRNSDADKSNVSLLKSSKWRAKLVDGLLLLLAGGVVAVVAYGFLSRPTVPFSITGTASQFTCRFGRVLLTDGHRILDKAPHFHVEATSLLATATTVEGHIAPGERTGIAERPSDASSFSFFEFLPSASIRVPMEAGRRMTVLGPAKLEHTAFKWPATGPPPLPTAYSLGFLFDHAPQARLWQVMASQQIEVNPVSYNCIASDVPLSRLDGALLVGYSCPFPASELLSTGPIVVPALGHWSSFTTEAGLRIDYSPGIFLTAVGESPITGSSVICEQMTILDPVGNVLVDAMGRSTEGLSELQVSGFAIIDFSPAGNNLRLTARGATSSLLLDGTQLVPTRGGRFAVQEPLIAGTISTLLAAIVSVLFITRGRAISAWRRSRDETNDQGR